MFLTRKIYQAGCPKITLKKVSILAAYVLRGSFIIVFMEKVDSWCINSCNCFIILYKLVIHWQEKFFLFLRVSMNHRSVIVHRNFHSWLICQWNNSSFHDCQKKNTNKLFPSNAALKICFFFYQLTNHLIAYHLTNFTLWWKFFKFSYSRCDLRLLRRQRGRAEFSRKQRNLCIEEERRWMVGGRDGWYNGSVSG